MAMRRYAAFLRGVMPTNAKMPALRGAFEAAGFTEVRTLLGSGNLVFGARPAREAALQRRAEAAMVQHLGRSFLTIVRSLDALREIVDADPYAGFELAPDAKRVVTFLRDPPRAGRRCRSRSAARASCACAAARCSPPTSRARGPGVHDAD